jgi:hypothetical protein
VALHAVQLAIVLDGAQSVCVRSMASVGEDIEMECFSSWRTKKVYVCPRGNLGHMGDPSTCGK